MRKTRHWKVQNNMNKVEKKRQKEQYIVEEMIRLYCRKIIWKRNVRAGRCVRSVRNFQIMRNSEVRNVRLWNKKHFAQTAKCIVINRKERADSSGNAFSGPRMLMYHPILAIWHLICSKREAKVKTHDKDKTGGTLIPCEKYIVYAILWQWVALLSQVLAVFRLQIYWNELYIKA